MHLCWRTSKVVAKTESWEKWDGDACEAYDCHYTSEMDGAEGTQDHCCVDCDQNDCKSDDFDVILQVFLECLQYAALCEDFKVYVFGPFV